MENNEHKCPKCGGHVEFNAHCAARVCTDCDHHVGLERCWCGWPNGQGRQELIEMGETIEPEDY